MHCTTCNPKGYRQGSRWARRVSKFWSWLELRKGTSMHAFQTGWYWVYMRQLTACNVGNWKSPPRLFTWRDDWWLVHGADLYLNTREKLQGISHTWSHDWVAFSLGFFTYRVGIMQVIIRWRSWYQGQNLHSTSCKKDKDRHDWKENSRFECLDSYLCALRRVASYFQEIYCFCASQRFQIQVRLSSISI